MSDAAVIASQSSPAEDDADLARAVSSMLGANVVSLHRRPSEFATLFPAEQITADLADGRHASLFVKHLGDEQNDHPDKQRRDREKLVYERLLANARSLPVPRCYGTRTDPRTGGRQLFLEFIADWSLKYHELEHWFIAARRLGEMHAHFASHVDELSRCDFLLKLDQPYYEGWLERGIPALASQSAALGSRLESLRVDYAVTARLLAQQPPTLVHNDLAPKNVIADRSTQPSRICIIDWELAGVGCALLDLVHLKFGLDGDAARRMMFAYCEGVGESGLLPGNAAEFARVLAACELHKTIYRLAHSPAWKLPADKLAQWVSDAESFMQRVVQP